MSEKFLDALKDDLPQDFAQDLYAQLQMQDDVQLEVETKRPHRRYPLTAMVASLCTVMIGVMLVINSGAASNYLFSSLSTNADIALQPITTANVDQMQVIGTYGNGVLNDAVLSPDGTELAVATSLGLFLHAAADLAAEPTQVGPQEAIWQIDYAEDGRLLGVTEEERRLFVVEPERDEMEMLYRLPQTLDQIWFHPDGERFLTFACSENEQPSDCGTSWSLAEYRLSSGFRRNFIVFGHEPQVAISPDWSLAALTNHTGTEDRPIEVLLLDLETYSMKPVMEIPFSNQYNWDQIWTSSVLLNLEFSPDGEQLALSYDPNLLDLQERGSGYYEGAVEVWNVADLLERESRVIVTEDEATTTSMVALYEHQLVFDPDGDYLMLRRDAGIAIYDLQSVDDEEAAVVTYLPTASVFGGQFEFATESNLLYLTTSTGEVQVWDWQRGMQTQYLRRYSALDLTRYHFTASGQHLIQTGQYSARPLIWSIDETPMQSYDLLLDAEPEVPQSDAMIGTPLEQTYAASSIALSPDGRFIAYVPSQSTWNNGLWLLDTETDEARSLLQNKEVDTIHFSTDGILSAFVRDTHLAYQWTTEDLLLSENVSNTRALQLPRSRFYGPYGSPVVVFSPDGTMAATYLCEGTQEAGLRRIPCDKGVLVLSNLEQGGVIARAELPFDLFGSLAFSPDGRTLALGYCVSASEDTWVDYRDLCQEGGVTLFAIDDYDTSQPPDEAFTLETITTQTGLSAAPYDIQLSHMADEEHILALLDTTDTTTLWRQDADGTLVQLNTPDVLHNRVTFSPDGLRMVTTTEQGQLQIWGVPAQD